MSATHSKLTDFTPLTDTRNGASSGWYLSGLMPTPEAEWQRLRSFLGLGRADIQAMVATVEPLFRRGHELVVATYDYLLHHHETAVILGWEQGADEEHLTERRRFFTVWLARTLGLDFSPEFARYLFRAGQIHAAHGPRQIHVPEVYVTGAVSLVHATLARFLAEEMPDAAVIPAALAAWNKVLSLHLHMMLAGYRSARELDQGDFGLKVVAFGRMREVIGRHELTIQLADGARTETALRKFFNYFPQARAEVLETGWQDGERLDTTGNPWLIVTPTYRIKEHPAWRVLLNGRDLRYTGGLQTIMSVGDQLSIFPPGR